MHRAGTCLGWNMHRAEAEEEVSSCAAAIHEPLHACLSFPLQKHRIGLKGPMTTPIGKGFRSLNLTLRKVGRQQAQQQ